MLSLFLFHFLVQDLIAHWMCTGTNKRRECHGFVNQGYTTQLCYMIQVYKIVLVSKSFVTNTINSPVYGHGTQGSVQGHITHWKVDHCIWELFCSSSFHVDDISFNSNLTKNCTTKFISFYVDTLTDRLQHHHKHCLRRFNYADLTKYSI